MESYYDSTPYGHNANESTNDNAHDYVANRLRNSSGLDNNDDRAKVLTRFMESLYRGRCMSLLNTENKDYYIRELSFFIYHTYGNNDKDQNWFEAERLIDDYTKSR